jgi:hypothetical protein
MRSVKHAVGAAEMTLEETTRAAAPAAASLAPDLPDLPPSSPAPPMGDRV